jgi:ASC-1-like (ASCH) protein
MIHLEIINSPDKNILSDFQFFQNEVYLGRSSGNLFINDPELNKSHVMVEVVEKDLIIHPQKGVESYLIDGKRASNIRKIKAGQIITVGKTTFKVLSFEVTEFQNKKKILDEKLGKLIESNSPRLVVIEKLAKLAK